MKKVGLNTVSSFEIDESEYVETERKIQLSHNFINKLRGPFRFIIDTPMLITEKLTKRISVDDVIRRSIEENSAQEEQTFLDLSSNWKFDANNNDRGFSSESFWLKNSQGERILAKVHNHPMCAFNEWFASVLGRFLLLPVNEVRIGIFKNKLVSLHTNVAHDNENVHVFLDLPRSTKEFLLKTDIFQSMHLFDEIIQNVDRNPRNILLTKDPTAENRSIKIFFIDHSSSFGVGKLNLISAIACQFRSRHLAVINFDPDEVARNFRRFLNQSIDLNLRPIRQTLERFSILSDEQIDQWLNQTEMLLTFNQLIRIRQVLLLQRQIAKSKIS